MRALNIPFTDRIEPFTKENNYAGFRAFSPTGQVPALIDGGRTVHDTVGITLYLADRHEGIWPADEAARAWAQCAVAEMHGGFSALRGQCTMNIGVRVKPKPASSDLQRDVSRIREIFEEGIAQFGGPYLTGAVFTAADAFFAPVAYRVRTYDLDIGTVGGAWAARMIAHPAMKEWETQALKETWREAGHEQELRDCGDVIADYRA